MNFKTLLIFSFSMFFIVSCRTIKTENIVKQKDIIKEIVHDTTFFTVPDTATYKALLDCQNGKVVIKEIYTNTSGKTHLKKAKVKIDNNKLSVDCEAKAQELFARWKSQHKVTTKYVSVKSVVPLTFFQKVQIWFGRIFLFILLLLAVGWILKFKKII